MTRRSFLSSLATALALGPWLLGWRAKSKSYWEEYSEPIDYHKLYTPAPYRLEDFMPRSTVLIVHPNQYEFYRKLLEDPKCPTSQA